MGATRWLTDAEKRDRLERLDIAEIDAGVRGLCEALNRLAGICTEASCQGHHDPSGPDRPNPGYLALRLSHAVAEAFDRDVEHLLHGPVTQARRLWHHPHGRDTEPLYERIVIDFSGAAHGTLDAACAQIVAFFTSLVAGTPGQEPQVAV